MKTITKILDIIKSRNKRKLYKTIAHRSNLKIEHPTYINLDDSSVRIGKYCFIGRGVRMDCNIMIGNNTHINRYSEIFSGGRNSYVKIGKFCSIAPYTMIRADNHAVDHASTSTDVLKMCNITLDESELTKGPIEIGNDVWIGQRAIILSGVNIGDGAVIAAGSAVTKDVQPYEIVAGVPARHIRFRFDKKIIQQLLRVKWWGWSEQKIIKNRSFFEKNLNLLKQNKIDKYII